MEPRAVIGAYCLIVMNAACFIVFSEIYDAYELKKSLHLHGHLFLAGYILLLIAIFGIPTANTFAWRIHKFLCPRWGLMFWAVGALFGFFCAHTLLKSSRPSDKGKLLQQPELRREADFNEDYGGSNEDSGGSNEDSGGSNEDAGGSNEDAGGSIEDAGGSNEDADGSNEEADGSNEEADGSNEEADGSNEEADGSNEEADGSNEEADGSIEEADGSIEEADGSIEEAGGSGEDAGGSGEDAGGSGEEALRWLQ
ncbi:hypothetical protein V5799_019289 [Amblyomma americanum]|uniref:Uncharacterized protein n=1 Tax=Amblyomma americanum TaxID=6943 RepID=A0AAQ4EY50_AMBAM